MARLDREIVLQTLRGYTEANRITQAERRSRLIHQSSQESLAIFTELYKAWEQTGQMSSGDRKKISKSRLDAHICLREAFHTLAKYQGHL
jgi:hypothetical protein